ncbi:MAG TPA: winged helix-turn-helix domain-containing protein [Blastocatellia bacterium]|nr:winged helix-turn-helix domain-containing protein [Blastocatellia bacterium]
MSQQATQLYEFGPYRLDPGRRVLLRGDEVVPLTPKTFDTLILLVEKSGRVIAKEELLEKVWPGTVVEEANLAVNISTIRKALGERPGGGQYIETVTRRGYRFVERVNQLQPAQLAEPAAVEAPFQETPLQPADAGAIEASEVSSYDPGVTTRTGFLAGRKKNGVIAALGVLALAVAAVVIFSTRSQDPSSSEPRRIAILYFRNVSQNPETDFLSFSLADAVVTRLGYVSSLVVRPSFYGGRFKDKAVDVKLVAAELDVDTLLVGSFQKEGDDLRVTAQLIDVATEKMLWGDTIDLKYEKLLTVQDRLAEQIINALHLNLSVAEQEQIKTDAPHDPLAYEYYLRSRYLLSTNKHSEAISLLERSVEMDPSYTLAWAYLGRAYSISALQYFGGREHYLKSQAAYDRGLALNPLQLETRIFMANLYTETNRVEDAVRLIREVLEINPNHAEARWQLSYAYRYAGMLTESIAEGERARSLDPGLRSHQFNSYFYAGDYEKFLQSLPRREEAYVIFYRGLMYYYLEDRERAAAAFDRAYELNDKSVISQIGKALRLGLAGRNAEGLRLLNAAESEIEKGGVGDGEIAYKIAQGYAALGDKRAALRALGRGVEQGFFCSPYLESDPLLNAVRGESEYKSLIERARARHEEFKRNFF